MPLPVLQNMFPSTFPKPPTVHVIYNVFAHATTSPSEHIPVSTFNPSNSTRPLKSHACHAHQCEAYSSKLYVPELPTFYSAHVHGEMSSEV